VIRQKLPDQIRQVFTRFLTAFGGRAGTENIGIAVYRRSDKPSCSENIVSYIDVWLNGDAQDFFQESLFRMLEKKKECFSQ